MVQVQEVTNLRRIGNVDHAPMFVAPQSLAANLIP
jgi:hypothetical protein